MISLICPAPIKSTAAMDKIHKYANSPMDAGTDKTWDGKANLKRLTRVLVQPKNMKKWTKAQEITWNPRASG